MHVYTYAKKTKTRIAMCKSALLRTIAFDKLFEHGVEEKDAKMLRFVHCSSWVRKFDIKITVTCGVVEGQQKLDR